MNPMNVMQMMNNITQLQQQLPAMKQRLMEQGVTDPKSAAMQMIQSGRFTQDQLNLVQSFARKNGIKF